MLTYLCRLRAARLAFLVHPHPTTLAQQLPNLAHYLLLWQDVSRVELFSGKRVGEWDLAIVEPPARLRLEAPAVEFDLGQPYEGMAL